MKQTSFFKKPKPYFGGRLLEGKRKSQRPLSRRHAMHLVLKAASPMLFKNKSLIETLTEMYAKRFGIKIYGQSVQRDHYHLSIRIQSREAYKKFIRAMTGRLAQVLGKGLWRFRPFTRLSRWGKAYEKLREYIEMNEREVLGLQPYSPRQNRHYKRE